MVDAHTIATFAFAQMRRDPSFARRFPWVRNTVVCVESDLVEDVLMGQMAHYFSETGGTVACYYPREQRMSFAQVGAPISPKGGKTPPPPAPGVRQVQDSRENPMTMGELLNVMYGYKPGEPHPDLPTWVGGGFRDEQEWKEGQRLVGDTSTVEIEKKLALT